jgi:hypothetical protein
VDWNFAKKDRTGLILQPQKHVKCTTENMITKLNCHCPEGQIYCSGTAPAEHTTADQSGASVLLTDATTDI